MADTKKKHNFRELIIGAIIRAIIVAVIASLVVLLGLVYDTYLTPNAGEMTYESCEQEVEGLYKDVIQEIPQEVEPGGPSRQEIDKTRKEAKQKNLENTVLCNDLAAQQAMSDRADWGLFVGGLGLIVLGITLWQTGKAARAASSTLYVANATLEEAKETAYRDLRAYAGVGDSNYAFARNDDGSAQLDVVFEMKNYGQTPAYNFQPSLRLELVDYSGPDEIEPAPFNDDGYTLNSGNTLSLSIREYLTSKDISRLVDDKARLFIVVALQFSDYKGEQRWERIHFVLPSFRREGDRFLKSHSGPGPHAIITYYRTESSDQPIISAT